MGDTSGAIDWLRAQRFTNGDIGITGFCWGGTVVWMAAAQLTHIKAGVAWYGRVVRPAPGGWGSDENRAWPLDVAASIAAPVLGLYAQNDNGIPLEGVERFRAALAAAGNPTRSDIIVYPGVQHGFHADRQSQDRRLSALRIPRPFRRTGAEHQSRRSSPGRENDLLSELWGDGPQHRLFADDPR